MSPLDLTQLTPEQRAMVDLWEAHLKAEFQDKDAASSCDTMVECPYVNHVPVLTGGVGRRQLEHFYGKYFIPSMPPDVELVPLSRTVGQSRIVDEFVFRCTHTVGQGSRVSVPLRRGLTAHTPGGDRERKRPRPGITLQ
jgi:carboxymethylenebutenolidase